MNEARPPHTPPPAERSEFPSTLDSLHAEHLQAVHGLRATSLLLPSLPGYDVLGEIGRAGMGVVYKAWQIKENRLVAIKMLRDGVLAGAEQFERFCNEAQILARLEHPHIIQVYEVGEQEGRLYMALRFAEGGSLADRIAGRGCFPCAEAAHLIEVLAQAMHHVHQQGILHRDLKPANILLDGAGSPMIADFGLGKRGLFQDYTISGAILGTPSYMSPEQAEGRKELRPATDVYSLGAMLYEMLAGRPPFQGPSVLETLDLVRTEPVKPPRLFRPDISSELEAICLKCLQKDPRERYTSAEDLADELRRAQNGEPLRLTGKPTETDEERRHRIAHCVQQGVRCLDRREYRVALLWYAEALRLEQFMGPVAQEDSHRLRLATVLRETSRLTLVWAPPSPITRTEVSPDGARIVLGHEDGHWRLLTPATGEVLSSAEKHDGNVNRVSFSPDGLSIVSGSDDGTARVWDARTGQPLTPPLRHRQWVTHAAFSPDGKHVFTASADGTAWMWDLDTGRTAYPALEHGGMLWSVALNEQGTRLVTTGWDGSARLWNARTGEPVAGPMRHQGWVRQAAFSPDGQLVATASDDQTARVWRVTTGEPLTLPLKHDSAVRRVAFSRDGDLLLTWAADGTGRVWEVFTGALRNVNVPAEILSGDGEQAGGGRIHLECGADGVLRLWDRASRTPGEPIVVDRPAYVEATVAGDSATVSPDGKLRFTVSRDGLIRVWDTSTCEEVTPPLPLAAPDWKVGFSPDGRQLIATSPQGAVRAWDLTPDRRSSEELVKLAQLLSGRRIDVQGNLQPLEPRIALAAWQELRHLHPATFAIREGDVERWHDRASLLCERAGLWQEARAHLDMLIQTHPTQAMLWARRGRIGVRGRHWEQALTDYGEAIRRDEKQWVYWFARGLVRCRLRQLNRAMRDLAQAAMLDRTQARVWYHLGLVRARLGRHRAALNDFTRALRRNPHWRSAHTLRAFMAASMKQWLTAEVDYQEAENRGEDRPWVRYQHALVCIHEHNTTGYQALCQKLASQAQRSGDVHIEAWAAWTAVLDDRSGIDPQRVLQWAERVHAAYSTGGPNLQRFGQTLLGAALYRAGCIREALGLLESQVWKMRQQECPWNGLLLSLVHQKAGNLRAARQWLRRSHRWLGRGQSSRRSAPPALPWTQQVELRLLRKQAEAMFRANPGPLVRLSRRQPTALPLNAETPPPDVDTDSSGHHLSLSM